MIQVVTAAHCVAGKSKDEIALLVGNPNAEQNLVKMNFLFVHKIEIYPTYNQQLTNAFKFSPDIALITLEEPVALNSKINPICLPSLTSDDTYDGKKATVSGWGLKENGETSTDKLMQVEVPIIANDECKQFYNHMGQMNLLTQPAKKIDKAESKIKEVG